MNLKELKIDNIRKQKKGIHFIIASILIWSVLLFIQMTSMDVLTKNFYTFCTTAFLVPIAFVGSKILNINFQNKNNPLSKLGFIMTLNQFLYLLIAIWIYNAVPEKMLMILCIIFGAHLLPFGWLYESKTYYVMSVFITLMALIVGLLAQPYVIAIVMLATEILFTILLIFENKKYSIKE